MFCRSCQSAALPRAGQAANSRAGRDDGPEVTRTGLPRLDALEAESIEILREVDASFEKPVMLYSVGKDSSVMLRLAEKAFHPSRPAFPLSTWTPRGSSRKCTRSGIAPRRMRGMDLVVHANPDGIARGIGPISHGATLHTDVMKTQALRQALDGHGFDAAIAGARRDEDMSRAKERVFSLRSRSHRWDPKNQRPELWRLYNTGLGEGESMRVFPLSNWTELDVWQYIEREEIPVVPLYFAAMRPVIRRGGMLVMVADARLPLEPGERPETRRVRFRTLGCYPLTGAVESDAGSVGAIIRELRSARSSERRDRAIDRDQANSMERKKQEGYF